MNRRRTSETSGRTNWDRVRVINEQGDRSAVFRCLGIVVCCCCALLIARLLQSNSLIELDEMECLILNVGEEVVFSDEGKDSRSSQLEEVGESATGLTIEDESDEAKVSSVTARKAIGTRTARQRSPSEPLSQVSARSDPGSPE